MIKLVLQNSIRHLRRNKLFTLLNILGLTIGISSCWIIYRIVSYELSFEKGFPEKENTYRLLSNFRQESGEEKLQGGVSRPIYYALREEIAGVSRVVPAFGVWTETVRPEETDPKNAKEFDSDIPEVIQTDSAYFQMLPYRWLAGNQQKALREPHQVVLTEKRAKAYFPHLSPEEVLGKVLVYDETVRKTVSGVVAELLYPSEFTAQEFFLLERRENNSHLGQWTSTNGDDRVYLQSENPEKAAQVLQQIQRLTQEKWELFQRETKPTYHYNRSLQLMPLAESHYATHLQEWGVDKNSKAFIYGLIALGVFMLLLACINYINLTTAQLPYRHKEIGIRKTLGSDSRLFVYQLLAETSLIVILAVLCSTVLTYFGIELLGDLVKDEVKNYNDNLSFALFIGGLLLLTIFLSGIYPSWLVTKVNPVDIFRKQGHLAVAGQNLNLRRLLIIFQFVIAQVFIVGALIVGQQLRYVVQKDMGFNKQAVVVSEIPYKLYNSANYHSKKQTLAHEIKQLAGVTSVSLGTAPLSDNYSASPYHYQPAADMELITKQLYKKEVDGNYFELYDFTLLAGEKLPISDTTNAFIINEAALHAFGFNSPQEALGKLIGHEQMFPIVGVVKDFHQRDFYIPIDPMLLLSDKERSNTLNIKLDQAKPEQWQATLRSINDKWKQFFPEAEFNYAFYDDSIAALYKKDQQLQKLVNSSMAVAIIISCLGLFGLATVSTQLRSKEIGIRKVLGASTSGIVQMLSKDFARTVVIAVVIASPLIWWGASKWLEYFVYRIEITWLPFVIGAGIALTAALLTISYQAFKAARANPVDSLRDE